MFYSQVILAKKGPLAKVWLAAHWGDKKLARPQIFATDISQSCTDIMNPAVPLALRLSGHLLLGVVRIYSRKVKYVLNDCTEAMLKLQMAFSASAAAAAAASSSSNSQKHNQLLDADGNPKYHGGRELLLEATDAHTQLIQNFGEFDRVHVVEGFCLPLPEDNEWILADDDHDHDDDNLEQDNQNASRDLLLAAHLPSHKQSRLSSSAAAAEDEEEEEQTWAPFDPDNDDDDDDDDEEEDDPNNSRVSDIEILRAANDSMLSEDQTRRSSILDVDKSTLTTDSALLGGNEGPQNRLENDDYDFNVPFGDDSEDEEGGPAKLSFGSTNVDLRLEAGTPMSTNASGLELELELDDDDDDNDDDDSQTRAAKRNSTEISNAKPRKRRRKRRKVVIDNHETELTNDHIRRMLQETDGICLPMVHPASLWDLDNKSNKTYKVLVLQERAQHDKTKSKKKNLEESRFSLTQPFLQDGSPHLHPLLKQVWKDNYWKALGEPCPYPKQETPDDVENLRRARDDESSREGETSDVEVTAEKQQQPGGGGEEEDDFDFPPPPANDDDEEDEMDVPVPDFGDDVSNLKRTSDADNDELLDLGMVNDMVLDSDDDNDDDDDDDDEEKDEQRQALGENASSSTKWHKHTVRVYKHLQKTLQQQQHNHNDNDNDDNHHHQDESVNFSQLTKHVVSRRNASSIFFEMLQLKTWDFIELQQDESYGNIAISAGVRFGEDAPN
eukprot:CAMPEP_0116090432 /NCGR_PEP_ID=MMETSP0327-20121206/6974_1 /TAXON_ID=44447 /ORGANISM="Pseudo-nitzschia delicatissima, Strain B596" /LENGTH=725 /DNA_ID=CAMNT_0003581727 /DNA_START=242 /DNA_END=2416 /DNA_ORIENTATION=+